VVAKSNKSTSPAAAKKASTVLRSADTAKASKTAAGSALAQKGSSKVTSGKAASAASQVLRDGRTGAASKSAAGSALSQAKTKRAPASKSGTNSGGPRKK
jgi:hypothetical protein